MSLPQNDNDICCQNKNKKLAKRRREFVGRGFKSWCRQGIVFCLVEESLFNRLFVEFDEPGRELILKTNYVVRILTPVNQPQLLFELEQIRTALAVDPALSATPALRRGSRVRIIAGPFMGIEGVVKDAKGAAKVWLNIEMIGQAVTVETERSSLEIATE